MKESELIVLGGDEAELPGEVELALSAEEAEEAGYEAADAYEEQ